MTAINEEDLIIQANNTLGSINIEICSDAAMKKYKGPRFRATQSYRGEICVGGGDTIEDAVEALVLNLKLRMVAQKRALSNQVELVDQHLGALLA